MTAPHATPPPPRPPRSREPRPHPQLSLELGDLTLLVGAQGTGKGIALQLLKFAHDGPSIAHTARANSLVWSTTAEFLDAYLGSGLGTSWRKSSALRWRGKAVPLPPRHISAPLEPRVFYVPAQRAITIADGWPRPFSAYRSAPYVVREFLTPIDTARPTHGPS